MSAKARSIGTFGAGAALVLASLAGCTDGTPGAGLLAPEDRMAEGSGPLKAGFDRQAGEPIRQAVGSMASKVLASVSSSGAQSWYAYRRTRDTTEVTFTFESESLGCRGSIPAAARVSFQGWQSMISQLTVPSCSGNFARPSGDRAIFWNDDGVLPGVASSRTLVFSRPAVRVRVEYAACLGTCIPQPHPRSGLPPVLTVVTFAALDAAGQPLTSVTGSENYDETVAVANFNDWDGFLLERAQGDIHRVRVDGYNNYVGFDDLVVTWINEPPVADAGGPYTVPEGTEIRFDGRGSTDPDDGTVVSHHWDFGDETTGTGERPQHTYAADGTYTVTLTVTDLNGATGTTTTTVVVTNVNKPPTIASISPAAGVEGSQLTLAATAIDLDGGTLSYQWTIGSVTETGNPVLVTFPDDGDFPVTLVVGDGQGGTATRTETIEIANAPPVVTLEEIGAAVAGEEVSLEASFTDPGADSWEYTIDWGDGEETEDDVAAGPISATHVYAEAGGYTVVLTVRDDDDGEDTATTAVVVASANQAPTLAIGGPYDGVEGAPTPLGWAGSDADGDDLSYSWDFGDGHTGSGPALPSQHTYADDGTYTLSATVSDGTAPSVAGTGSVEIDNSPPTVQLTPSATTLAVGQTLTLTIAADDAGEQDGPWAYSIDWDDGQPAQTGTIATLSAPIAPTRSYSAVGSRTITVLVTDKDGGTGTRTASVSVSDGQAPSLTLSATPGELWPPNHKYHRIRLQLATGDNVTPAASVQLSASVVSSDPDDAAGGGDGNTSGDIQITRPYLPKNDRIRVSSNSSPIVSFDPRRDLVDLRAERPGSGEGRVYTITITATDAAGNTTTRTTQVTVPHDQGNGNGKGKK